MTVRLEPDVRQLLAAYLGEGERAGKSELVNRSLEMLLSAPPAVRHAFLYGIPADLKEEFKGRFMEFVERLCQSSGEVQENWTETPNANPRRQSSEQKGPASAV